MSKKRKRKKRIITEDIKLRRRIRRNKKKNTKRRFFQFFVSPLNGYHHLASYCINDNKYWIANFREVDNNKLRYLAVRYGTEEEIKIIEDVCGSDCPLIDIALCNNKREAYNAIKEDAKNPVAVIDLFDFENYEKIYEEMKKIYQEKKENKDE